MILALRFRLGGRLIPEDFLIFLVLDDDSGARLRFGVWPSPLPAWVAHRLCERLAPRGCQVEVMICACVAASARGHSDALGARVHVVCERSQKSSPPIIF